MYTLNLLICPYPEPTSPWFPAAFRCTSSSCKSHNQIDATWAVRRSRAMLHATLLRVLTCAIEITIASIDVRKTAYKKFVRVRPAIE